VNRWLCWLTTELRLGNGVRGRKRIGGGTRSVESRLVRGLVSLVVAGVFTVGVVAAFVAVVAAGAVLELSGWVGIVCAVAALVAPLAAIVVLSRGNDALSRTHRERVRRRGVALPGKVIDCQRRVLVRYHLPTVARVVLTVRFEDPENEPQTIRRRYTFDDDVDLGRGFIRKYTHGARVTVHRDTRRRWYVVDVDDENLAWNQKW
jgi:hypothetical protein